MPELFNSIIIGGGLAGLSAAYWAKKQNPDAAVAIVEKEAQVLSWIAQRAGKPVVLGSTSNSTLADESLYPRGSPEVLRLLQKWSGSSTRDWLVSLGLDIQETADGTIFLKRAADVREVLIRTMESLAVNWVTGFSVESISRQPDETYRIWSREGEAMACRKLLLATGGERNHGLKLATELGAEVSHPLPAFLRLRLASPKLGERLGPMRREVKLRCLKSGEAVKGELEISPRGIEGPALSALSCRHCELWKQLGYRLRLEIDWLADMSGASVRNQLLSRCERGGRRMVGSDPLFGFTEKQWNTFLKLVRIEPDLPWARLKAKKVQALSQRLKADVVNIAGMGLPADERAWAGGVQCDSIDSSTCESISSSNLYYCGEMIDALGMPGGLHSNLTWATAYQAGSSMGLESR